MTLILTMIEAELLQEHQNKFNELEKFAFELHKLNKIEMEKQVILDMENQVIKEMAKLKKLIDRQR